MNDLYSYCNVSVEGVKRSRSRADNESIVSVNTASKISPGIWLDINDTMKKGEMEV